MSKFKRLLRPRNLIIFFLVFTFLVIISGVVFTIAGGTREYYKITPGSPQSAFDSLAVGAGGTCYVMSNNSGVAYFVPTKTKPEWDSFVAAAPRLNVALSSCQYCGDGSCNNGETCSSCASDCGLCICADNSECHYTQYCDGYIAYCKGSGGADCGYQNKTECVNHGCNWQIHTTGVCVTGACVPDCGSRTCGPNGCGGSCGTCTGNTACSVTYGYCVSLCGNGTCAGGEDCSSCSSDCGSCGGTSCPDDSYCPPGQYCAGLIAYCQGDWYCDSYTNMSDCGYYGCDWALQQTGTCSY